LLVEYNAEHRLRHCVNECLVRIHWKGKVSVLEVLVNNAILACTISCLSAASKKAVAQDHTLSSSILYPRKEVPVQCGYEENLIQGTDTQMAIAGT
jgi:hypothetical protein